MALCNCPTRCWAFPSSAWALTSSARACISSSRDFVNGDGCENCLNTGEHLRRMDGHQHRGLIEDVRKLSRADAGVPGHEHVVLTLLLFFGLVRWRRPRDGDVGT